MTTKTVQVSYQQLAQAGLGLVSKANVPADDIQLALAQGVRQMLHGIAEGSLAVVPIPADKQPAPPPAKPERSAKPEKPAQRPGPARHSDGVVPPGGKGR